VPGSLSIVLRDKVEHFRTNRPEAQFFRLPLSTTTTILTKPNIADNKERNISNYSVIK